MNARHEFLNQFDIEGQHEAVTAALYDVSLDTNALQEVPSLDDIAKGLDDVSAKFLLERTELSAGDRLVIAPYLGDLSLLTFMDKLGYTFAEYYAESRLSRSPAKHNQDKNALGWSVGFMLRETIDPLNQELLIDPGLVYRGKTVYQQSRDAKAETKAHRQNNLVVRPVTLMEYAIDDHTYEDFIDHETGEPNFRGTTRLIHLPTPNIGYAPFGQGVPIYARFTPGGHPGAAETDKHILWATSSAFFKNPLAGVRRVLKIA
jgi:hypothetical protein